MDPKLLFPFKGNKKRVAFLLPEFDRNEGTALVSRLRIQELLREGHEVSIFALTADMEMPGVEIHSLGMPENLFWRRIYRLIFPLDICKNLRWLNRLKGYDYLIVLMYPFTWLAWLAQKRYGVKYIYYYHGFTPTSVFVKWQERIYKRLEYFLTKLTARSADNAITVSEYAGRELKKNIGLDSQVIYNWPDAERFHPGIDGSGLREQYKLGDAPVILSVGRIGPQKAPHLLIQVLDIVKKSFPDAKLMIIGKFEFGHYTRMLREMSDESVMLLAPVPNEVLPYYYAMCDIFAVCSVWETFNTPIAEAQYCGKPVVAFDIGPHPEVINKEGILIEPGNVEQFAEACVAKIRQVRSRGEHSAK